MRNLLALGLLVLLGSAPGCATPKQWSYAAEPLQAGEPLVDAVVVVPKFEDVRVPADAGDPGWAFLPFVPWTTFSSATPEQRWEVTFVPDADLPRALADEVENARIFRSARFAGTPALSDYVLEGKLTSTHLRARQYLYGFSSYGMVAWLFGAPVGITWNELSVELTLRRADDPHVVWSHSVDEDLREVAYIDDVPGHVFRFDELWKRALTQALPSLRAAVETLPRN